MPIQFTDKEALVLGVAGGDEAEALLRWVQQQPCPRVGLEECTHLHTAVLQVLLAGSVKVSVWPRDDRLRGWLQSCLDELQS